MHDQPTAVHGVAVGEKWLAHPEHGLRDLAVEWAGEIDPGVDEALNEFIAKKKAAAPDSNV